MKDPRKSAWNESQKKMRSLLNQPDRVQEGIDLFLAQHGMLHAALITPELPYHFQDDVLDDFPQAHW